MAYLGFGIVGLAFPIHAGTRQSDVPPGQQCSPASQSLSTLHWNAKLVLAQNSGNGPALSTFGHLEEEIYSFYILETTVFVFACNTVTLLLFFWVGLTAWLSIGLTGLGGVTHWLVRDPGLLPGRQLFLDSQSLSTRHSEAMNGTKIKFRKHICAVYSWASSKCKGNMATTVVCQNDNYASLS